jgi:hypothetical protein
VTEDTDGEALLARLEAEERLVSRARARLHKRIDYARTMGDGAGNPATPEQLAALDAEERAVSARRKELHAAIDRLRA